LNRLVKTFESISIGNPLNPKNLMGPLISKSSFEKYFSVLRDITEKNLGKVYNGYEFMPNDVLSTEGFYVTPCIVEVFGKEQPTVMKEETFAPLVYVMYYDNLDDAIELNNDSIYGLSSSIFSNDMREVEAFLSARGSDCGIANANIGTSGAEIGGAFGGEKYTGGGRESGSDAWKSYMRRQTNTLNYGDNLPLAQGIQFDL
jgi:aldehyde dehydrogenase (NAD+)